MLLMFRAKIIFSLQYKIKNKIGIQKKKTVHFARQVSVRAITLCSLDWIPVAYLGIFDGRGRENFRTPRRGGLRPLPILILK